jgi:uncharacterized membrane protein
LFDDLTFARAIHVMSVVIWFGGVYFVTFVVMPELERKDGAVNRFEAIENRFAKHARIVVTTAGVSGFYLLYRLDGWDWYQYASYWWLHAMTALWLVFSLVLFVAEPLFLHAWFIRKAEKAPIKTMSIARRFHQVLTLLGFITIAGAIYGVHF